MRRDPEFYLVGEYGDVLLEGDAIDIILGIQDYADVAVPVVITAEEIAELFELPLETAKRVLQSFRKMLANGLIEEIREAVERAVEEAMLEVVEE